MKPLLLAAATPLLVLSLALATNIEKPVVAFPYQQSWKIGNSMGHGSMFPIQIRPDGVVFMTAKHVTQHMKTGILAYHPNYGIVRRGIKVLYEHPTLDIATVFVPIKDPRIIAVLPGDAPKLGDRCTVVAYPGPGRRRITEGNICGPNTMSAQIIGGSSGGPVFNKEGRLIGVVRAVDVRRMGFGATIQISWMGYFTPVSRADFAEMLRH